MAISAHLQRTRQFLPLLAIATAIVAGCYEPEKIHSYSVPKEPKPPVTQASRPEAEPGEPTDRMLAAIVPAGGQAYFFKVVGPIAAIEKHEKEFNDFFAALRVGDDGKPKWQLPEGWKEGPGNAMRLATIVVPAEPKPLDITVNALPWSGTPADMLSNVNRWRGQLQLPPTDAAHVAESSRQAKAGDLPITIVDLRGHFAGSGMTPPFAGAVGAASRAALGASADLPPGHPPIDSNPGPPPSTSPSAAVTDDTPKFVAPADWKPVAPSSMQKAAFGVGDAQHGALVTIIPFSTDSGPSIADPLQNANMWRGAVGMPPIKADELSKSTESIEIDGKPATYVRAVPDPSQTSQSLAKLATLAAMVKTGDRVWFVKLHGDRTVVAAQEDAFKTFLKSLRFAAGSGAP
jgi:hypothetical protein